MSIKIRFFGVMLAALAVVGCTKPNDNNNSNGNPDNDVVVTTYTPSDVTASTAVSGCSVQVRQGLSLTKIGVCWSTSANPTAADNQLSSEAWNEPFVKTLTGLSPNTTYHVRAFALRGLEYYYGEDKAFTTLADNGGGGSTYVHTITVSANPSNGGTVSGGGTYQYGQTCTIMATQANGYVFSNWTENENVVSTNVNYTFNVTGNRNLVANFIYNNNGGHDYVDLGLPSGTLWATCNVGANAPEEYGDYFAWGETTPKTTYVWSNYEYCNGGDGWNTLTKYCNNSSYGYNGFTDNLTVLEASDDAATAQWGSGWRMPTQAEWQELLNNTTKIWTTQNGLKGKRFTASNGKSIFLPAAGVRFDDLHSAGTWGFYWSSSLYLDGPVNARNIGFNSNSVPHSYGHRRDGCSVRPVCSSVQN